MKPGSEKQFIFETYVEDGEERPARRVTATVNVSVSEDDGEFLVEIVGINGGKYFESVKDLSSFEVISLEEHAMELYRKQEKAQVA